MSPSTDARITTDQSRSPTVKELDVLEPKLPEQIYKSHLEAGDLNMVVIWLQYDSVIRLTCCYAMILCYYSSMVLWCYDMMIF